MSASHIHFDKLGYTTETFNSSGTFNVPEGVDIVYIEMYGAGGGGDNTVFPGSDISYTSFGGEAGDRVIMPVAVSGGAAIGVTIGAGGAGNGGDTLFGGLRASGGLSGGYLRSDLNGTATYVTNGHGRSKSNIRAVGGTSTIAFQKSSFGGDAGYGAGGNDGGGAGGIGAGGGSGGGTGGNGICLVTYKIP